MKREGELRKDLTPDEFGLFRDWIHTHSGIFLEDGKIDSLRISLVTRATRFGFTDYRDYFKLLSADEDEFKELMNLVTINETFFFRFPAQFDAFRDKIIPEIMDGRPRDGSKQFRVWSAGCSTGEEPYTIAISMLESALEGFGYHPGVLGTDVSTQALDRARRAVYTGRAITTLEAPKLSRWFEPAEEGHRPIKRVRDICSFQFHNLIREPYPASLMSGWDVIFCRNVTIYFRIESTRRVVDAYYQALNPGGYLFIGHSETLTSVSDRFEPVEIDGVFLYRKPRERHTFSFSDAASRRRTERAGLQPGLSADRSATPARPRHAISRPTTPAETVADRPSTVTPSASAGSLVDDARSMLDQARAPEALRAAQQALVFEPGNIDAHLVAAFAFADLGRLDEATAQAGIVLEANPLTAGARYILGVIKQQQGDTAGAAQEFKRTLYIDSDFVLAHFALANAHRQRGASGDAAREYQNAIRSLESNPNGSWTAFLGGFTPELLRRTCERSLLECGRGV